MKDKENFRNMAMFYSRVMVRVYNTHSKLLYLHICDWFTNHLYHDTIGSSKMCACRSVCLSCNRVKESVFALPSMDLAASEDAVLRQSLTL